MTAEPVAMQLNPAYGVGVGQGTIMATNIKSVTMQSNPAYDVAIGQDTITLTNAKSVAMQSNPAYSALTRGETTQSESEMDYITIL